MYYINVANVAAKIIIPDYGIDLGENYKNYCFFSNEGNQYDVLISFRRAPPCFNPERLSFQVGIMAGNKFLLRQTSYLFMRKQEVLIARKNFSNCRFWHASPDYLTPSKPNLGECIWPMIAIWGYLSTHGMGVLLHGALVKIDENFVLFLGQSGVGKSTLSRLTTIEGGVCLTDENPFLRCHKGLPWVYGSPWYSESELIPSARLPRNETSGALTAVFILHHASYNQVQRLTESQAVLSLLKNCRTFNWLPDTIPDAINILDIVARKTPVYSFGFLPNSTSIAVLRQALEQQNEH